MSPRDIFVMKDGTSLVPVDRFGRQQVLDLKDDRQYRAKLTLSRSLPHHRKYWGMLSCVVNQTQLGDAYPTAEILHDVLMKDLGYIEYYPPLRGGKAMVERRKSSAFDTMDQLDFEPLFNNVVLVLSSVLGMDPTTLRRQADAA